MKETINKIKGQHTKWEEISVNNVYDKKIQEEKGAAKDEIGWMASLTQWT